MGNCLRLGISRVGLAWSKWRMSTKFKRKNVSIIILGMQAVGKSTIALRLYKFKRTLPDLNYVQTKGFNTFTVKRNKTTVNLYDLGGHPSIQELWDHYYADAHGVIFVVDTSKRDTMSEAGQLLSQVLSDKRIRGKPVLLLANKIDLEGISETELDTMLNLQQLVNSVRCLTRLDVSCATDLKNDKGIFAGFKWLISHIESNFMDLNTRVLSDVMEEKNREKARREAVKAARLLETNQENSETENILTNVSNHSTPSRTSTHENNGAIPNGVTNGAAISVLDSPENRVSISPNQISENDDSPQSSPDDENLNANATEPAETPYCKNESKSSNDPAPRPISVTKLKESGEPILEQRSKLEPAPLPSSSLPPIVTTPFVEHPIKLPRLKSPKSRPEIINRIEDHGDICESSLTSATGLKGFLRNSYAPTNNSSSSSTVINDQYYEDKGFRFRKISAARRLSPEGADSDDGIVNLAYEPTGEDLSSDSTPIGVRRVVTDAELANKEILMVTTLAEVHKEYFKDRKGSTSTHDSMSMSMTSMMSETNTDIVDDGQSSQSKVPVAVAPQEEPIKDGESIKKPSTGKGKTKKKLNFKSRNKTAPAPSGQSSGSVQISEPPQEPPPSKIPTSATSSKESRKVPFTISTVANAWDSSSNLADETPGNKRY